MYITVGLKIMRAIELKVVVGRRRPVDDGRDALRQFEGEVVEREHGEGFCDLHADVLDAQY